MPSLCPVTAALAGCLRGHGLSDTARPLVAGVSGGSDSVALAMALSAWGGPFVVLHVDHGQHAGSARAAAAVQALAAQLGAPCDIARLRLEPGASENELRAARFAAFAAVAAACGAAAVLTAHHADDQVETVLLRMQRGTGARGLAGIPPARALTADVLLLRPFLGLSKATLAAAVTAAGLGEHLVEDPTNTDLRFARNALRAKLLPVLRARHGAGFDSAILERAHTRRFRVDARERAAREWLAARARIAPGLRVELPTPVPTDRRLAREILRLAFLELTGGAPSGPWLARAIATLGAPGGTRLDGGGGVLGERTREGLLLIWARARAMTALTVPLEPTGEAVGLDATGLHVRMVPSDLAALRIAGPRATTVERRRAEFDIDAAPGPWLLRVPRDDDRFDAPGMQRPVRLLPHLARRGVPGLDRPMLPVLIDARGGVVWAPHLDVAAYARIVPTTEHAVRVEVRPPSGSPARAPSY